MEEGEEKKRKKKKEKWPGMEGFPWGEICFAGCGAGFML
jgi:hypothetical protein